MKLAAYEPWALRQLDRFTQTVFGRFAADLQPLFPEPRKIVVVDLITMPVPFGDALLSVNTAHHGFRFQHAFLTTQAHGAAKLGFQVATLDFAVAVLPLRDERDHRMRAVGIEFGAMCTGQPCYVARKFDYCELHAEADTQVRNAAFACMAYGLDLAFDASPAEATGHEDCVHAREGSRAVFLYALRINVVNLDLGARMQPSVD